MLFFVDEFARHVFDFYGKNNCVRNADVPFLPNLICSWINILLLAFSIDPQRYYFLLPASPFQTQQRLSDSIPNDLLF